MFAVNTVSWGGHNFNYAPDEIIDLPDQMAIDRINAGHMRHPNDGELAKAQADGTLRRYPGYIGTEAEQALQQPQSGGKAAKKA